MNNLSLQASLKMISAVKNDSKMSERVRAWGFNSPSFFECTNFWNFIEEYPILPKNIKELDMSNECLKFWFLAQVSQYAYLSYPKSMPEFEEFWLQFANSINTSPQDGNYLAISIPQKDGSSLSYRVQLRAENLSADSLKYLYVNVQLVLMPLTLLKNVNVKGSTQCIKFSVFGFTAPYNRFVGQYCSEGGSIVTCKVSFRYIHVQLDDVLNADEQLLSLSEEELAANSFTVSQEAVESLLADGTNVPLTTAKMERYWKYKVVKEFIEDFVGKELTFCGKYWQMLCCNIAGALKQSYIYTSRNRSEVARTAITNLSAVINPEKPMILPLRLSLFNSICIHIDQFSSFNAAIRFVPDYVYVPGNIELTDGCGRISPELAELIIQNYKNKWFSKVPSNDFFCVENPIDEFLGAIEDDFAMIPMNDQKSLESPSDTLPRWSFDKVPSAFQIRYKGCKGMLVVDNSLNGKQIIFSASMKKFDSGFDSDLYIVGVSFFRKAVLSSELICMFEGASANNVAIEDYLTQELHYFRSVDEVIDVREFMLQQSLENHCLLSPYIKNLIFHLNVPLRDSAHIYGVADFSFLLEANEVSLTIDGLPILGTVIITKTPALSLNDMRKFTAVDKLEHLGLENVLVFSTKSAILVPSQLSGADLDGDQFYVFWNENLVTILNKTPNAEKTKVYENDIQRDAAITEEHLSMEILPDSHLNEAIAAAEGSLTQSANSFKFCGLQHLLALRRVFVDFYASNWPEEELMHEIARWLRKTFEAPKHGKWIEWEIVRERLKDVDIPKPPDYYAKVATVSSRQSTSLFARLYTALIRNLFGENISFNFTFFDTVLSTELSARKSLYFDMFIRCNESTVSNFVEVDLKKFIRKVIDRSFTSTREVFDFYIRYPYHQLCIQNVNTAIVLRGLNVPKDSVSAASLFELECMIETVIIKFFQWQGDIKPSDFSTFISICVNSLSTASCYYDSGEFKYKRLVLFFFELARSFSPADLDIMRLYIKQKLDFMLNLEYQHVELDVTYYSLTCIEVPLIVKYYRQKIREKIRIWRNRETVIQNELIDLSKNHLYYGVQVCEVFHLIPDRTDAFPIRGEGVYGYDTRSAVNTMNLLNQQDATGYLTFLPRMSDFSLNFVKLLVQSCKSYRNNSDQLIIGVKNSRANRRMIKKLNAWTKVEYLSNVQNPGSLLWIRINKIVPTGLEQFFSHFDFLQNYRNLPNFRGTESVFLLNAADI